jgi:hypothetical protein
MSENMVKLNVEYTDTFGGEANYSWVQRADVVVGIGATRRAVVQACKRAVGLTGIRGVVHDHGDGIEFRPYRHCTVMFANVEY